MEARSLPALWLAQGGLLRESVVLQFRVYFIKEFIELVYRLFPQALLTIWSMVGSTVGLLEFPPV